MVDSGQRLPAASISQRLLDVTGTALMTGNFELFAPAFSVPTVVCSEKGRVVLDSLEDIERAFRQVVESFRREGVTDLVRYCLAADYLSDTKISATHESCQMRGDQRALDPYPAYSIIELIEGAWKVTYSEYGFPEGAAHARAFPGPAPLSQGSR